MKGGGDFRDGMHPKLLMQREQDSSTFPFQDRIRKRIERRLAELAERRLRSEQNLALAKKIDLPPDILEKISQQNPQIPPKVLKRFMGVPRESIG